MTILSVLSVIDSDGVVRIERECITNYGPVLHYRSNILYIVSGIYDIHNGLKGINVGIQLIAENLQSGYSGLMVVEHIPNLLVTGRQHHEC